MDRSTNLRAARCALLFLSAALCAVPARAQSPDSAKSGKAGNAGRPADSLFETSTALPFELRGDLRPLMRDRDTANAKFHPVALVLTNHDGTRATLAAQARTRGIWRRKSQNCTTPPLRLRVAKQGTKGTAFAGRKSFKLVTHCRPNSNYEQYVLREYLAYRIYNLLTPFSFNARLARVTYADTVGRDSSTHFGILIEDDDDLAARNNAKVLRDAKGGVFSDFDPAALALATAFQYMIGNTDWSLSALHNMRIIVPSQGSAPIPVPYDFDFAGLVETTYATPDPRARIKSVRDRTFRGNCLTEAQWAPIVARFNDRRAAIYALYDSVPALDRGYAGRTRSYLDEFYKTINHGSDLRAALVESCREAS